MFLIFEWLAGSIFVEVFEDDLRGFFELDFVEMKEVLLTVKFLE